MAGDEQDPGVDDLAALERAIAALGSQRALLGDDVVDTALAPLLARRTTLADRARGEQRRLVTVVFADLVGFTELSERLDPEDVRTIVDSYFSRWLRVVEEHGGVVEKFIGDAMLAVFGLRQSWEDDAQRAVRASLAMLGSLGELNADLARSHRVRLRMRVGVDTGDVVVSTLGDRGGAEFVVVGPTVNRASRLESAAPPDGIVISSATQHQLRGRFGLERIDDLVLKGIDEPVTAYRVVSERPHAFRLDRSRGVDGVETTTVGRESELRFLQERLLDVIEERRWRVVTVVGDAGVGKSRLLLDFDSWLAERSEPVWWFRGRASHTGHNRANGLLRDVIAGRFAITESDSSEEVRRKLEAGFATAYDDEPGAGQADAHLVGAWLGLDVGQAAAVADPQILRDRATEALGELFSRLSRTAPVVVLLEDLHWADDGSLRWLDAADALLADCPVLVVGTTRPSVFEDRPRWGEGLSQHVRLTLDALSPRESRSLLGQLLHRVEDPPAALLKLVVDSAEGNPFFIEELVTWLVEAGVVVRDEPRWRVEHDLVGTVLVPSTLRGVLQSRLDALSPDERSLLQRASVVGRVFWDDAVQRLASGTPDVTGPDVTGTLGVLRGRDLVFEREVSTFATAREFLFKHALLRDVAYDGVLRSHRRRYHARVAGWLAEVSAASGREDEYAALVAQHYDRAGDPQAGPWHFRAARQAVSVYALTEAAELLARTLDLVTDDPVLRFDVLAVRQAMLDRTGERDAQQLDLTEMGELVDRLGDDPRRLAGYRLARSRSCFGLSAYDEAESWAEQAANTASGAGLRAEAAEAHLWRGKSLVWHDEADAARASLTGALEEGRAAGRPLLVAEALRYLSMLANNEGAYAEALDLADRAAKAFAAVGDLEGEGTALVQLATTSYNLNRMDEARATLERVLPIFRRSRHSYREAIVLGNLGTIAMSQGQLRVAQRWTEQAVTSMRELGDREATANNVVVLGMIAAAVGRWDVAEAHYREAVEISRDVESTTCETDALACWALLLVERGETERALDTAQAAAEVGELAMSAMERGKALVALGYAALAAGRSASAARSFAEAEDAFEGIEVDVLAREAQGGRAAAALALGDRGTALSLVEPLLAHVDLDGVTGMARPSALLATCWRVLSAAEDPRTDDVLARAQALVLEAADRTGDPELAAGYLDVPVNAALLHPSR